MRGLLKTPYQCITKYIFQQTSVYFSIQQYTLVYKFGVYGRMLKHDVSVHQST